MKNPADLSADSSFCGILGPVYFRPSTGPSTGQLLPEPWSKLQERKKYEESDEQNKGECTHRCIVHLVAAVHEQKVRVCKRKRPEEIQVCHAAQVMHGLHEADHK